MAQLGSSFTTNVAKQQTTSGGTIGGYSYSNANSTTAPTTAPATPSNQSPYYPRYTPAESAAQGYINNFQAPPSEDQLYSQKLSQAQGEIDSLNKLYDQKLQEQDVINQGRNRSTQSINTLTGLGGSTEANNAVERTDKVNKRENDLILAEKNAQISNIFARVRSDASKAFQSAREEARMNAEQIMASRKQRQEEATKNFTLLAQSGVTLDGLKQSDPQSYQFFAEQLGGEQMMQAMATLNRPQDTILDKKIQNGKYIISYQNPLTGSVRIETVDLGLPPEYSNSIDAGDRLLFVPDGWDGDTSKLVAINKGLTPQQAQSTAKAASTNGLVDANGKPLKLTATQVDTLSAFDSTKSAATDSLALLQSGVQTGPVTGRLLQGAKLFDKQNPDQVKLEQLMAKIKADFMKAISGAAVSEKEVARLQKFLPDITDQEGVLKSKLDNLIKESDRNKQVLLTNLGAVSSSPTPAQQVAENAGYSYEAMRRDGLTDDQILQALQNQGYGN